MRVYCDTDTLFSNIKVHEDQPTVKRELETLEELFVYHRANKIVMFRSLVNRRELEETKNLTQLEKLRSDYESLPPLPKDERPYGAEFLITDPNGGCISNPLVSDVQDEQTCAELKSRLESRDAEHITQAICNHCDIFLTRDRKSIIKHRDWIEGRFSPIKVRLPSEALVEVKNRLGPI
jgi:hypothetical protein